MSAINDFSEFSDDNFDDILTCSQSPASSTVLNLSQVSSEDQIEIVVFEDDTDFSASLDLYEEDGDHFILVERNPRRGEDKRSSCDEDGGNFTVFTAKSKFCGEEAVQRSRNLSSHCQPLSIPLSSLPTDNSYALMAYVEDNTSLHLDEDLDHDLKRVHWCYRPKVCSEDVGHDENVGDCADVLMAGAWIKDQRSEFSAMHIDNTDTTLSRLLGGKPKLTTE